MYDKIKGMLYSVFIGDALGTTYEFKKSYSINVPKNLKIVGGGPFKVEKGQVTDDSEMTLALTYSILRKKTYDKEDVAKSYIRWIESEPKDNGNTTAKALRNAKTYKDTVNNSFKYNQNSLSNGFLMRISPLAIIGLIMEESELDKMIEDEVKITHSNPLCYHTAKLYIYMLIYVLRGGKDYIKEALRIIYLDNPEGLKHDHVLELHEMVLKSTKNPVSIRGVDGSLMGYMLFALQISLYHLINSTDYEDSFKSIIKLGGDTDTNCAIAGAFLGAKFGFKKIPDKWVSVLLNAKYDRPEEFKVNPKLLEDLFFNIFLNLFHEPFSFIDDEYCDHFKLENIYKPLFDKKLI